MRVALKFTCVALILTSAGLVYLLVQKLYVVKDSIDNFNSEYGGDLIDVADEEVGITYYILMIFGALLATAVCLLLLRTTLDRDKMDNATQFEIDVDNVVGESEEERFAKAQSYAESFYTFSDFSDNHKALAEKTLAKLAKDFEAVACTLYRETSDNKGAVTLLAAYAHNVDEDHKTYAHGEGLIGQVAKEGGTMLIEEIPEKYIQVFSGLGSAEPSSLMLLPLTFNGKTNGVIELAFFKAPDNSETAKLEVAATTVEALFSGVKLTTA